MNNLKLKLRNCLADIYHIYTRYVAGVKHKKDAARLDRLSEEQHRPPRVFYLGITAHSNLGDMAQHYCITKWIRENYPDYELVMFESNTVVDKKSGFLEKFKKIYGKKKGIAIIWYIIYYQFQRQISTLFGAVMMKVYVTVLTAFYIVTKLEKRIYT